MAADITLVRIIHCADVSFPVTGSDSFTRLYLFHIKIHVVFDCLRLIGMKSSHIRFCFLIRFGSY